MKPVGKQLVGVTANEHLVEIEKGQLVYDIVHLDISENADVPEINEDGILVVNAESEFATITILLNDDDLEISVYSSNSDVNPVSVQKISKDKIKQFNSE